MKRKNWESNRDIAKKSKKVKFWCWGCDGCLVSPGIKCPVCHTRIYPRRFKKD
jgi:hypothetical protein